MQEESKVSMGMLPSLRQIVEGQQGGRGEMVQPVEDQSARGDDRGEGKTRGPWKPQRRHRLSRNVFYDPLCVNNLTNICPGHQA